jgi:two-component system KDP operon response regulator KdpE
MANKLSVLIIDDEPQIQRLLKIGLTAEKFRISDARTVAAALKLIETESFDIFILDIGLPDESGCPSATTRA